MQTYTIHGDAYSLRVAVADDADKTGLVKAKLLDEGGRHDGMDIVVEGWMYQWIEESDSE